MSAPYQFENLVAVETTTARQNVIAFADKLYADQLQAWEANKASGRPSKARPPTLQECRTKSVQIRVKRERDSVYWNDLISPRPVH